VIPEEWEALPAKNYFSKSITKGYAGLEIYSVTLNKSWQKRSELDREIGSDVDIEKSLLAEKGDLVYNTMRMWQGALGLAENTGVISPAYIVLKPKEMIDSKFAFYQLKSYRYLHYLKSYSYGLTSDRLRLYFNDFGMIPFICPPLKEQQKIAQILTTWDEAISKQEQLITTKERLKKGLMQKLLSGEVRFAGFDGEWEEVKLGDVFTFIKTYSLSRKFLSEDNEIQYLHYGDLHTKYKYHLNLNDVKLPSVKRDDLNDKIEYLQDGDLIVADASEDYEDIGKSVEVINADSKKVVAGLHTHALRDKNNFFVNRYRGYVLYEHTVKKNIKKIATGISVLGISKSNLSKIKIKLPPKPEQQKIAQLLTLTDKEIELLKEELEALKEQKRGLMQRLLTGEVRVKEEKYEL
jgi:type I restriction enzyme S subunit